MMTLRSDGKAPHLQGFRAWSAATENHIKCRHEGFQVPLTTDLGLTLSGGSAGTEGGTAVRVQGVVAGFGGVIRVMGRLGGLMARAGRGAR